MEDFTRFSHPLWIEYAHKESRILQKATWRVVRGFRYHVESINSGIVVDVPRGYLVDGASVPRLLWSYLPPWGAYGQATVVHDLLCEYLSYSINGIPIKITRKMADDVLAEAMGCLGVPELDQVSINIGVDAYRKIAKVQVPSRQYSKAELEAKWLVANPE